MDNQNGDMNKCPFMSGEQAKAAGGGTSNRDWWPNELKLNILRQNGVKSNPLGGDFNSLPPKFFNVTKYANKTFVTMGTQTDNTNPKTKNSSLFLTSGADDDSRSMVSRKLHRGVDSPGYDYNVIISLGKDGTGLWRKFADKSRSGTTSTESFALGDAADAHYLPKSGNKLKRHNTPEVTGWGNGGGNVNTMKPDRGNGNSRQMKSTYKGNPVMMKNRGKLSGVVTPGMNEPGFMMAEKQRTDQLLAAAGL